MYERHKILEDLNTNYSTRSEYRLARQKAIPPPHSAMLVRPSEQRVVVGALVVRAPAGTGVVLALQVGVRGAHDGLAQVVEAVRRVVGDLLLQPDAVVPLLVVLDDVRQAVQLVEHRHHVRRPVRRPVYGHDVGLAEVRVGSVVLDLDVASSVYIYIYMC